MMLGDVDGPSQWPWLTVFRLRGAEWGGSALSRGADGARACSSLMLQSVIHAFGGRKMLPTQTITLWSGAALRRIADSAWACSSLLFWSVIHAFGGRKMLPTQTITL
jgi:hypothetical protein